MNLVIDGIVYGFQRHGGINTYFNEILPRIARMAEVQVDILLPRNCLGMAPHRPVRRLARDLFPMKTGLSWKLDNVIIKWINQAVMEFRIRSRPRCVFHSTYFTCVDRSVPQVGIAYDLNHEKFTDCYDPDWVNNLREQYRKHLTQAHRIIAISDSTKNDVVKYYGISPTKIDVVHLGVDHSVFVPNKDPSCLPSSLLDNGRIMPYLLYVGGRSGYKNFNRLLRGFSLSDFCRQGYLVVAGKRLTIDEKAQIESLNLTDRVRVVVNPTTSELSSLYSFAAGFVYPSMGEGFGIPVLEAMACGTPALLSDIPVFREIAEGSALYFDPFDCEDIARCLDATRSAVERKRFVELGLHQVSKFSWDSCAAGTLNTYRRVLCESRN